MRLIIDVAACQGNGRCAAVAPNLVTLNSEGYLDVESIEVPNGLESEAKAAVANCPELCLSLDPGPDSAES